MKKLGLIIGAAAGALAVCAAPLAAWAADTQIVITSGTTWTVPVDWNNLNNHIDVIGGATAANVVLGTPTGAGGGAFSRQSNMVFTAGAVVNIQIGPGLDTWVSTSGTLMAKHGIAPTGGQAASSVGTLKYNGGNGATSGGGGGAAGPHGAGNNGSSSGGGSGDAGFGGAGGNAGGSNGANGTEYGSVGSGGGGGGGSGAANCGAGGNYGGGPGSDTDCTNPISAPGLIVITYQPRGRRGSAAAF